MVFCRDFAADAQIYECSINCERCHLFDYDLQWRCVKCQDGWELWNDCCRQACGQGYYAYGCECKRCTDNCASCVGPEQHECTECAYGFTLDFRGMCVRDCNPGWYPIAGDQCAPCDPYCLTCLTGTVVSCLSCHSGYNLTVRENATATGECMQACPGGFFRDASADTRCLECAAHCDNCTDYDHCTLCEPGATLWYGICYPFVDTAAAAAVDFDTYMDSGAGVTWDWEEAPDWQELTDPDAPETIHD